MAFAAIYARISVPGQEPDTSLIDQIVESIGFAEKAGYTVLPEHLVTDRFSGSVLNRPGLDRIRGLAASGEVQAVYGRSLDRFTRDPYHALFLMHELEAVGVLLVFDHGPPEITSEEQLIMDLEVYVGRKEREYIVRQSTMGKEAFAKSGRLPYVRTLFGYYYDPALKKRTINEAEAAVVRDMYQWAIEGVTPSLIGLWLKDIGTRSRKGGVLEALGVKLILPNRSYTGVDLYVKCRAAWTGGQKKGITSRDKELVIEIRGFSPAILSIELFEVLQGRL